MSLSLHASALTGEDVQQALPIIQATWPRADLSSWLSYSKSFTAREEDEAGILALRDGADVICGVVAYRLEPSFHGRELSAHLFTAVDLANSLRIVEALLDATMMCARRLGCCGLHIRLDRKQAGLARRLRTLGLVATADLFHKLIEPTKLPQ